MKRLPPLLAAFLLAGCTTDDDCAGITCGAVDPPIELRVRGSAAATITASRQDGAALEAACQPNGSESLCTVDASSGASQVGVYLVQLEAPGFQPVELDVVVEATPPGGCCNPGYVSEYLTIDLAPL